MTTDADLNIIFDAVTKSVVVNCRDQMKLLYGPFETRSKAFEAARKFARDAGWIADT